jgi:hypothetical protein
MAEKMPKAYMVGFSGIGSAVKSRLIQANPKIISKKKPCDLLVTLKFRAHRLIFPK